MAKTAKSDQRARLDVRLPTHVKDAIEEAAALRGVTTTAIILNCAYPEALRRIESAQRIQLNAQQRLELLEMLERPGRFRLEIARAVTP